MREFHADFKRRGGLWRAMEQVLFIFLTPRNRAQSRSSIALGELI